MVKQIYCTIHVAATLAVMTDMRKKFPCKANSTFGRHKYVWCCSEYEDEGI